MLYRCVTFTIFLILIFGVSPNIRAESMLEPEQSTLENDHQHTSDSKEYPEAYLIEAEQFRLYCSGKATMSNYYNCDCLANKYLESREEFGPFLHGTAIISGIKNKCIDAAGAAGTMYTQCVGSSRSLPKGTNVEKYCMCFSNTYAEFYQKHSLPPGSKISTRAQSMARTKCLQTHSSVRTQ